MERSGMSRHRCADRRGGRSLRRGGLDDSSAERHRGPARRAGVRCTEKHLDATSPTSHSPTAQSAVKEIPC